MPPDRRAANREGAVGADGEAARVDGACLGWPVELELVVCDDGASAPVTVAEDTVREVAYEGRVGGL